MNPSHEQGEAHEWLGDCLREFIVELHRQRRLIEENAPKGAARDTEDAAGAEGPGTSTRSILFEIDSIGMLPFGTRVRANHLMGFELIPRQ